MRRIILLLPAGLLAALVLVIGFANAQAPANKPAISNLEKPIYNCERQVAGWRRTAATEITFIAIALALGAIVSGLQASKSSAAKQATVVLGIMIAILTGVNGSLFPADVKTLRRAAADGDAVIGQLWIKVGPLQTGQLSPQDQKAATEDFGKELSRFQVVADTLSGSTTATTTSWNEMPGWLPVVHAQAKSTLPAWTSKTPSDTATARYVVGKASAPSLAVAKQNSTDAALYNAALTLIPSAPHVSRSALLDLIKASAVTQDSAFAFDGSSKNYDYYTLLRLTPGIEDLVKALPAAPTVALTVFQARGWQPADMTSNATSGLFVLDRAGGVSKLTPNQRGAGGMQKLFQIPRSQVSYAIAASADSVYAATSSSLGCTIYKYSLADRTTSSLLMAAKDRCVGVADDGSTLYVTMPERKEIRYWDKWDASSVHTWSLGDLGAPGYLEFDGDQNRLIVVDDASGKAYGISIPDGKQQLLSANVGAVQSIAASRFHILLASGKKVLFLARSDNHGENLPMGWPALPGGNIVGVAVDGSDSLWIADYDKKLVEGPLPLI